MKQDSLERYTGQGGGASTKQKRYDRFSDWLEQGKSKEEIMKRFDMSEQQFERAKADVERIRKERRNE